MSKTVKFIPKLAELIKAGKKTTTFRFFDDKNLSVGDHIKLAIRDGQKVSMFGMAKITEVKIKTISTLQPEDFVGHEPVTNILLQYRIYYGDKVQPDTELKVIRFKIIELF